MQAPINVLFVLVFCSYKFLGSRHAHASQRYHGQSLPRLHKLLEKAQRQLNRLIRPSFGT